MVEFRKIVGYQENKHSLQFISKIGKKRWRLCQCPVSHSLRWSLNSQENSFGGGKVALVSGMEPVIPLMKLRNGGCMVPGTRCPV